MIPNLLILKVTTMPEILIKNLYNHKIIHIKKTTTNLFIFYVYISNLFIFYENTNRSTIIWSQSQQCNIYSTHFFKVHNLWKYKQIDLQLFDHRIAKFIPLPHTFFKFITRLTSPQSHCRSRNLAESLKWRFLLERECRPVGLIHNWRC